MPSDLRFDIFPDALGAALAVVQGGRLVALGHRATAGEAEEDLGRTGPEAERAPSARPLPALRRQLAEYLAGERRAFDLPLAPQGTDFQRRVWQALTPHPLGRAPALRRRRPRRPPPRRLASRGRRQPRQ